MLIEGVGHYVSLMAEGPGDPLWYSESGSWTSTEDLKKVFTGVVNAVRTPILGLPSGYRARLVCSEVEVVAQAQTGCWCG
jgi:hypothetical protein